MTEFTWSGFLCVVLGVIAGRALYDWGKDYLERKLQKKWTCPQCNVTITTNNRKWMEDVRNTHVHN